MPHTPALQAIGVDEGAGRRGHRYGTILVDRARHRVVDLLPDRSAASVAAWLAQHPTASVVCRDRSPLYADGLRQGAPTALQVVDRFPLVDNLREAVEAFLRTQRGALQAAAVRTAQALTPLGSAGPVTPMDSGAASDSKTPAASGGMRAAAPIRALGRALCRAPHAPCAGHPGGDHRAAAGCQPSHGLCVSATRGSSWSQTAPVPMVDSCVDAVHSLSHPPLAREWRA
jgi:Transposase